MARKKSFSSRFKGFKKSVNKSLKNFDRSTSRLERQAAKAFKGSKAFKAAKKKFGAKRARTNYGYRTELRKGAEIHENIYPPIAYAVTIAKLKRLGRAIPRGPDLNEAVRKEVAFRINAVGFLRAGWLSAVAIFARSINKPVRNTTTKFLSRFGHHGGATVARVSNNPFATFWNMAASRHTSTELGERFARDGLQAAMQQEITRIGEFVARRQQARTKQAMGRFFR